MTAVYAKWNGTSFDCSYAEIPCYNCGDDTVVSCTLCGVFVCNDCSIADENDESICLNCVENKCSDGIHFHHSKWKYADDRDTQHGKSPQQLMEEKHPGIGMQPTYGDYYESDI